MDKLNSIISNPWVIAIIGGALAIVIGKLIWNAVSKNKKAKVSVNENASVTIGDSNKGVAIGKDIQQNIDGDSKDR